MDHSARNLALLASVIALATTLVASDSHVLREPDAKASAAGIAAMTALLYVAVFGLVGVWRANAFLPAIAAVVLVMAALPLVLHLVGIVMLLLAGRMVLVARRLVRPASEWYGSQALVVLAVLPAALIGGFTIAAGYRAVGLVVALAMAVVAALGMAVMRRVLPEQGVGFAPAPRTDTPADAAES